MKLNHDCVRDLLLAIEKHAPLDGLDHDEILKLPELDKYDKDTIIYTAQRLHEAGYIDGNFDFYYDNQIYMHISNITYDGHVFLDSLRDEGIWKDVKNATAKVSGASIPILLELGTSYIKTKLGLS